MIHTSPFPKADPIPKDINVYDRLFGAGRSFTPDDSVALADDKDVITYKQLHDWSTRIGAGWIKQGLKPGDVVLMSVPTGPLFFLLFCSLQAAGIIASLANPVYGESELAHAVKVVGAKFVVTTEESIAQCLKIGVKKSQIILFGSKSDQSQDFSEFRQLALDSFNQSRGVLKASGAAFLTSDSPAAICFSSGTTGLPKAVMISGMNLIFQSDSVRLVPGFSSGEREATLTALPAFHIAGLLGGVDSLFEGEAIHFAIKAPFDIIFVAKRLQEVKAGRTTVVPPILLALIRHPETKKMKFPHLRHIMAAAAPLGPDLQKEAHLTLNIPIIQGWGLSETTGPVTLSSPLNAKAPYGSAGIVLGGSEMRIVDPESGKDVSYDEPGEVWMKSPANFLGYLGNEKATRETFAGEWLKTGDIGIVKRSGDLFIVDRLKELLKYKGMQVAPAELEDVLLSHPKVADAAVVGIRDGDGNDLPRAYIVTNSPQTSSEDLKEEVRAYVASKVAPFKHLRGGVEITEIIPKNPSGKILRRLIRDQAEKETRARL